MTPHAHAQPASPRPAQPHQYSPAQYSHAQYSPAQYSHAQYSHAQYAHAHCAHAHYAHAQPAQDQALHAPVQGASPQYAQAPSVHHQYARTQPLPAAVQSSAHAVAPSVRRTRSRPPQRFRFNASALCAGLLALMCLAAAGVFVGEAMKHNRYVARQTQQSQAASAELATMEYGPDGNVTKASRSRYAELMRDAGSSAHLATMKQTLRTEAGIGIAALLAAAGFGFVAARMGRGR